MEKSINNQSRPQISPHHQKVLASGDYSLNVQILLQGATSHYGDRSVVNGITARLMFKPDGEEFAEDETTDFSEIEIGHINAWRIVTQESDEIQNWSIGINEAFADAIQWAVSVQTDVSLDKLFEQPALYIEKVYIEPAWRGIGLTLPAVATFLDLMTCKFVFFQAHPFPDETKGLDELEIKQKVKQLIRFWQKLGFNQWTDREFLAAFEWTCPEWLRAKDVVDEYAEELRQEYFAELGDDEDFDDDEDEDFDDDFDDDDEDPHEDFYTGVFSDYYLDEETLDDLYEAQKEELESIEADENAALPSLIELLLTKKLEYELTINIRLMSSYSNQLDRYLGNQLVADIELTFFNLGTTYTIGSFTAWKTQPFLSEDFDLAAWADHFKPSVRDAFNWLEESQAVDLDDALLRGVLFVDRAYIKPKWRGRDFSLQGLTTLIETTGSTFVFLMPLEFTSKNKRTADASIRKLRKHWARAGLDQYDKQHNYLWSSDWDCPAEFRALEPDEVSVIDDR